MNGASTEEIALVISGRDDGASKTVRDSINALSLYGRSVDATNKQAVAAFRESAAAEREYIATLNNNTAAMQKLEIATGQFERRIATAEVAANRATPGLRAGGNAAAYFALSLSGSELSARSLLRTSSTLAFGLSSAIPTLSEYAVGIGLIAAAGAALYETYERMNSEIGKASDLFERQLALLHPTVGQGADERVNDAAFQRAREQIELKRQRAQAEIDEIESFRKANVIRRAEHTALGVIGQEEYALTVDNVARLDQLRKTVNEANAEQSKLEERRDDTQRRVSEARTRARETREASAARTAEERRRSQSARADAIEQALVEDQATAEDSRSRNRITREIARLDREFDAREHEIDRLTSLSAARRAKLHAANLSDRNAQGTAVSDAEAEANQARTLERRTAADAKLAELVARDQDRVAQYAASTDTLASKIAAAQTALNTELRRIDDEKDASDAARNVARINAVVAFNADVARLNRDAEREKQAKTEAAEKVRVSIVQRSLDQLLKAHKLSIGGLVAALLEPKIIDLEADAAAHFTKAASNLFTNPALALAEGAQGARSLAGAAAIQQLAASVGGQTRSGGSGGGGGGAASTGADSFTPRGQGAGGGDIHITFLSASPLSPENVNALRFQINRADVLNKPMQYQSPAGSLTVRAG